MGSWWPAHTVQALLDAVPMGTVLVLDEAYIEFAPPGTAPGLDVSRPNVIRYRTFSKAYGMAGARIAYAIAEESVAKAFDKYAAIISLSIASHRLVLRPGARRQGPSCVRSSRRLPAHGRGSARSRARMAFGATDLGDELRRGSTAGATVPHAKRVLDGVAGARRLRAQCRAWRR